MNKKKRRGLIIAIFMSGCYFSVAQTINGEYQLNSNNEMVAAFKFNVDSSFEFYFIYGAVDRTAKGTYSMQGNKIKLTGEKIPGKDFTIRNQAVSGNGTTIKISDGNPYLQKNILCLFIKGNQHQQAYTDESGLAHATINNCDSIFILHTLFPDILTTVKARNTSPENYFELTLNPSLAEISFKNFFLTIKREELTCSLPRLFQSENSVFVKR